MRKPYFFGETCFAYAVARARENRNIEVPSEDPVPRLPDSEDPVPRLPDEEPNVPVETPPPRGPDNQPDPPPIREPNPDEPTRLF